MRRRLNFLWWSTRAERLSRQTVLGWTEYQKSRNQIHPDLLFTLTVLCSCRSRDACPWHGCSAPSVSVLFFTGSISPWRVYMTSSLEVWNGSMCQTIYIVPISLPSLLYYTFFLVLVFWISIYQIHLPICSIEITTLFQLYTKRYSTQRAKNTSRQALRPRFSRTRKTRLFWESQHPRKYDRIHAPSLISAQHLLGPLHLNLA